MPNYVSNIITINESGEKLNKILEAVKSENSVFDFNKIIPMPEGLDIESGSRGERCVEYLRALAAGNKAAIRKMDENGEEYKKECILLGAKYLENQIKHGAATWYEWCPVHWGTKWNACGAAVDGNKIMFDTAWNAPEPIYQKLAEMFPDCNIEVVYADEDCGYNAGRFSIDDGECVRYDEEGGSDAAYACYFETHPGMKDEMHKDENGRWVWNE